MPQVCSYAAFRLALRSSEGLTAEELTERGQSPALDFRLMRVLLTGQSCCGWQAGACQRSVFGGAESAAPGEILCWGAKQKSER